MIFFSLRAKRGALAHDKVGHLDVRPAFYCGVMSLTGLFGFAGALGVTTAGGDGPWTGTVVFCATGEVGSGKLCG